MKRKNMIGKRDFIQHTSRYLKRAEMQGDLIITHQGEPMLQLTRIEKKTIKSLRGLISYIQIHGDINEPILMGYEKW